MSTSKSTLDLLHHPSLSLSLTTFTTSAQLRQCLAHIITSGLLSRPFTMGRLLACTARFDLPLASSLFAFVPHPSPFTFNTMIRAFSQSSQPLHSLHLYLQMLRSSVSPNRLTLPFVLRSCSALGLSRLGRGVHCHAVRLGIDSNVYFVNNCISFYSGLGDLRSAHQVFDQSTAVLDVVSWTALLTGYSNSGRLDCARRLFDRMPSRNLVSWNCMVGGYALAGRVEDALELFDGMPERNVASWSSLVSGFAQAGRCREALAMFRAMVRENVEANEPMLVSLLSCCAQMRDLEQGLWVHEYIEDNGFALSVVLGTVLVDMYGKCGSVDRALRVFTALPEKNLYSWNSMITGLAMNGAALQALTLFWKMLLVGLQPNDITFIGLLSACSHSGLVDEGGRLFNMMIRNYGIRPLEEHYGCMVDLLGRAGLMKEAVDFVENMPVEPHPGLWGALAGACQIHGDTKLAEKIAKQLIELEPRHGGRYVLLSNIYGAATRWDDMEMVRNLLKQVKARKGSGSSVVDAGSAMNV